MRTGPEAKREMSAAGYSRVFTLEVDGRPILAFESVTAREAQQLAKESWLLDDLMVLTAGGAPLRTAQSKLSVRLATAEETDVFVTVAETAKPSDDVLLAYLVDLDTERR
jgi:hypothetical protein